jgi:Glycosyl transferase family 2
MLPFFFRHYDKIVSRYVIFDDSSCDGSLELLRRHPKVEVRPFARSDPESFVLSELSLSNECWKLSRGCADWVIVVDIDEHVFHPDLPSLLRRYQDDGVTIVPALGYQMISEEFPPPDALLSGTYTWGAPCDTYSKLTFFNPDSVTEVNYAPGRHGAHATGHVIAPAYEELLLLHYKFLGFERTLTRHRMLRSGLRSKDIGSGWGVQYGWSKKELREAWDGFARSVIDIRAADAVRNYPILRLRDPFRQQHISIAEHNKVLSEAAALRESLAAARANIGLTAMERDAALSEATALRESLAAACADIGLIAMERDAALSEATALRTSTSWAITRPLRALSSLARRGPRSVLRGVGRASGCACSGIVRESRDSG